MENVNCLRCRFRHEDMLMPLSVVGLIGRRHAVQGLAEELVRSGHAVLPCNRAMNPWKSLYGAQIFVNSATEPDWELLDAVWQGRHRIIDISGSLEQLTQRFDWKGTYISRGEIGRKNVEILLDRAQAVMEGTEDDRL